MPNFVVANNLGTDFDVGVQVPNKINIVAATTARLGKMRFATATEAAAATAGVVADASQVQRRGHSSIADANYSMVSTDVFVGMTTLTASRVWTLPPAASYPAGATLFAADESGNCSLGVTITVQTNSISTTASAAVNNAVVLPVASTAGIVIGQALAGAGISGPVNVLSISGLNVTVSANVTIASGTALTFSDVLITGGKNSDGSAITSTAIAAPGQKLAWHSNGSSGWTYQ